MLRPPLLLLAMLLTACAEPRYPTYLAPAPIGQAATADEDSEPAEPPLNLPAEVGHRDFAQAKRILPHIFTGTLQDEFYCGCPFSAKRIDLDACGYVPRHNPARASRLEWEHIVPAWAFGHLRPCWQRGGRPACAANDPEFQTAEGDLHNLVPAVGEVNGDRSNFPFGLLDHPTPVYGRCQTVVDFAAKRIQPRAEVRGRIARMYFYMHDRYQLDISGPDRQLMCDWARRYPIDGWELERDRRIQGYQGDSNPYVADASALVGPCGPTSQYRAGQSPLSEIR